MARWAELMHTKLTENTFIEEEIVYDGLENFAFSQYDPNNINHAIGKKSLFTYEFNFCPLNRKGRMTAAQVKRKKELEDKYGPYPRDAIRAKSRDVFRRLLSRTKGRLTLFTDEHFQYERAIEDIRTSKIDHIKISSRKHRNFRNHLFAVNNIDMQARHFASAFRRETIAFSKTTIAMQESFFLYIVNRNYMRPKFFKKHKHDPYSHKRSPAMEIGIMKKILTFEEFFQERVCKTQVNLNKDFENLYHSIDPDSRRPIRMTA